jgi:protoporphyrinogen oxidase
MSALPEPRTAPVVVLGAGLAGLVAARELRRLGLDVVVYEASNTVGGMAGSHVDPDGFTFDTGAHFITNRLAAATGVSRACRDVTHYGETVWLDGRSHDYPLGLLTLPRFVRAALEARLHPVSGPAVDASERFRREYGRALAEEVAIPLVEAWSGIPGAELSPAVAEKIPSGLAATVALRAAGRLTHRAVAIGYCREAPQSANVWHVYPEHGVATVSEQLAHELADDLRLESPVDRILTTGGRAVGVRVAGQDVPAAAVVSTAPANLLPALCPEPVLAPLAALRFRPMVFVNLRFTGRPLLPDTVTWVPDRALPFFRLTETPQSMPWLAPPGKTLVTADIGAAVGDAHWSMDDDALGELCVDALATIVPGVRARYLGGRVIRSTLAYPAFHLDTEPARLSLARGTGVDRLVSIGRNGEFAHILMEDVYWRTVRRMRGLAAELTGAATLLPA